METNLVLTLNNHTTVIPYPAMDREEWPHQGFRPLKGNTEEVVSIPAVKDNAALRQALVKINDPTSPFFTIACRKFLNSMQGGFWVRGYIEFSFNYLDIARDSPNYFLLFEQFAKFITASNFDLPVDFNFEIRDARFVDMQTDGHTVCVWITTGEYPADEGALMGWNQSVGLLAEFLGNFEKPSLPPIF